ncbi:hypothetical protein [Mycolicibacterium stellerae]|uniref:hypothetical protein n=1 Tax=Mycolicibacterium stellerae TaxID=2358193 RepID=UPI003898E393
MTIGLPSGDVVSAMYFADCGNGAAVAGAGVAEVSDAAEESLDPVASVASFVPLEQADRVPKARRAMTPSNRMRMYFFM